MAEHEFLEILETLEIAGALFNMSICFVSRGSYPERPLVNDTNHCPRRTGDGRRRQGYCRGDRQYRKGWAESHRRHGRPHLIAAPKRSPSKPATVRRRPSSNRQRREGRRKGHWRSHREVRESDCLLHGRCLASFVREPYLSTPHGL